MLTQLKVKSRTITKQQKALQGVFHACGTSPRAGIAKKGQTTKGSTSLEIVHVEYGLRTNNEGLLVPAMNETSSDDLHEDEYAHSDPQVSGKRSMNAYFQFRSDQAVKARYLNLADTIEQRKIVQLMAAEWNSLSDAQKLPYQAKAEKARRRHKQRLRRSGQIVLPASYISSRRQNRQVDGQAQDVEAQNTIFGLDGSGPQLSPCHEASSMNYYTTAQLSVYEPTTFFNVPPANAESHWPMNPFHIATLGDGSEYCHYNSFNTQDSFDLCEYDVLAHGMRNMYHVSWDQFNMPDFAV